MINLLPLEEKQHVRREYRLRVIATYVFFLMLAALVAIIMLLPSYFFVNVARNAAAEEARLLEASSESAERAQINRRLDETKERLVAVTDDMRDEAFYELIEGISSYVTTGTALTSISYTRGEEEGQSTLVIGGIADTRSNLLTFTRSLEDDERFSEVTLPVSSLASEEDIDFTITITGEF